MAKTRQLDAGRICDLLAHALGYEVHVWQYVAQIGGQISLKRSAAGPVFYYSTLAAFRRALLRDSRCRQVMQGGPQR